MFLIHVCKFVTPTLVTLSHPVTSHDLNPLNSHKYCNPLSDIRLHLYKSNVRNRIHDVDNDFNPESVIRSQHVRLSVVNSYNVDIYVIPKSLILINPDKSSVWRCVQWER